MSTEIKLQTESVCVGYGSTPIVREVSTVIPAGEFSAIIGPNACGKSTLLRGIARVLPLSDGSVLLDGKRISTMSTRAVAQEIGLLPQTSIPPEGITVVDLVSRGRYPRQRMFDRWSRDDQRAVAEAMRFTRVSELSGQMVDQLSGGQRQRVWVAMVLAQETDLLLLDEPTTFLDIAHQYDLLELFRDLRDAGRTVVCVLHDLNQAARYAAHVIVMKGGEVVAEGPPARVVTAELVQGVYGLACKVISDPVTGSPLVVPLDPRAPLQ